jgi:hypothetical protein
VYDAVVNLKRERQGNETGRSAREVTYNPVSRSMSLTTGIGNYFGVTRVMASYELTPGRSTESGTISDRVLLTIVFSSACSSVGTANLSNVC